MLDTKFVLLISKSLIYLQSSEVIAETINYQAGLTANFKQVILFQLRQDSETVILATRGVTSLD